MPPAAMIAMPAIAMAVMVVMAVAAMPVTADMLDRFCHAFFPAPVPFPVAAPDQAAARTASRSTAGRRATSLSVMLRGFSDRAMPRSASMATSQ